jgi:hypothetical protein
MKVSIAITIQKSDETDIEHIIVAIPNISLINSQLKDKNI